MQLLHQIPVSKLLKKLIHRKQLCKRRCFLIHNEDTENKAAITMIFIYYRNAKDEIRSKF